MKLDETKKLVKSLLEKYGLSKWGFSFDNASSRFGFCNETEHKISLSKKLVLLNNKEVVKEILLHEIAHALVGGLNHHNKVWKNKAVELGCNSNPHYGNEVITPPKKWVTTCPNCGHITYYRRRLSRAIACGACCDRFNNGKYSLKFKLEWKKA